MAAKTQIVRCRYGDKYLKCTEPAVDPIGPVLLCRTHLNRAHQLAHRLGLITQGPEEEL